MGTVSVVNLNAETRAAAGLDPPPKAVRAKVERALDDIAVAAKMLREAGYPQNADDLMRSHAHLKVCAQVDGWLDMIGCPR